MRQQLAARQAADLSRANDDLANLRAGITLRNPAEPGNAAIAYINVEGAPNRLAAFSQLDAAGNGIVGRGPGIFEASPQPNAQGVFTNRVVDAEYKILDNLAATLGNNRNASGSVTLFTELPTCASCTSVIDQFRRRYPNVTVNIVQRGVTSRPAPQRSGGN